MTALWTVADMTAAMAAHAAGLLPEHISGLSIDTRTIAPGEAFFAITGEARDGHEFVGGALERGAGLAVVSEARRGALPCDAPLLAVPDVLDGLTALARAARSRTDARVIAVTGSVGKTSTKEALRLALAPQGETHASAASYNNHWGVPLSLARMPQDCAFAVFEIGMNHAGEITPLTQLVRPHVAIITTIEPVHLEHLGSIEGIADAKAEIFAGVEPGGAVVLNRDNPQFTRLQASAAAAGIGRVVSFGEAPEADARLLAVSLKPDCSTVRASILGDEITYKLGAPGHHIVMNSLAVLSAAVLAGADLARAALALAQLEPPAGRGARIDLVMPDGGALLIDESYNANPASMRAALMLLGQAQIGRRGRRIAVLGDMLELGPQAAALHGGLAGAIEAAGIDLVYCAGPLMAALWSALPSEKRGGYAETSGGLEPQVLSAVRGGDAIMVKGSLGSRMGPIVKALATRYTGARLAAPAES
jgi:UDP-N-acetylmuramoyl-tripeptide--D-alanyl-D-alanine ligase